MKSEEFVKLMVESVKKEDEETADNTIKTFYTDISKRVADAINGYTCDMSGLIVETRLRNYADSIRQNMKNNGFYKEMSKLLEGSHYEVTVIKAPML